MSSPATDPLAALFGELTELAALARADRLLALQADQPVLARQLRALLDADRLAGDFLGVLAPDLSAAAPPTLAPGSSRVVGRFRLIRPLGAGGMGIVWLARDERLDRPVALKLLHGADDGGDGSAALSAGRRARFETEARAAARLEHPHVAVVHDVGEAADGTPFIAMAYYDGGSLAERLDGAALPAGDVVRIGRQLAQALGAAHDHGVVHGDVKPSNVLFDARGGARLADFGVARLASAALTPDTRAFGTPAYLAPEVLRGAVADHRADLWALGVTLHEMLTGRRPFDGPSGPALAYHILAEPPPPITSPHGPVAPALVAIVHRLLEKEPAARPASAVAVARALETIQAAADTTPHPEAPRPLVSPLTSLVGRERELEQAMDMIAAHRLVTVTGPGGVGKTRLATELARLADARFAGGIRLLALADVRTASGLRAAITIALGLQDVVHAPFEDRVRTAVGDHEVLFVLDNFEQLLDSAREVAGLLATVPRLHILVTSRAPLRLQGEHELPLLPLTLAPAGATTAAAARDAHAVRLFLDRARAGRADFVLSDDNAAAVAAICRQLDGLPLAIELAAIRTRVLEPAAILERLRQGMPVLRSDERDRERRHRTLHDVIDWSYQLLTDDERQLLRQVAVFASGFTLQAAAAVGDLRSDGIELLDRVAALVDWSLLVRQHGDEPRFTLLATIREFLLARLRDAGDEPAARERHLAYFLALAERAAPELRGPSRAVWLSRLEREHVELRAALETALALRNVVAAARLTVALHWFWLMSRSFSLGMLEPVLQLQRAVAADITTVTPALRGRLLLAIGGLTAVRGDPLSVPIACYEGALAACRDAGDPTGIANTLNQLGWMSLLGGDLPASERYSSEALQRHTEGNNALGVAAACINLGWLALARGDVDQAERRFARALALQRECGDQRGCAYALGHLATSALRRGAVADAVSRYESVIALCAPLGDRILEPTFHSWLVLARHEALRTTDDRARMESEILPELREAGHAWSLAFTLAVLGRLELGDGDLAAARSHLEQSLALAQAVGYASAVADAEALLGTLAHCEGDRAESGARWASALRARVALGEAIAVSECLDGIAWLAADTGDAPAATRLLAGAAAERARLGITPSDRAARRQAALRRRLDDLGEASAGTVEPEEDGDLVASVVSLALRVAERSAR